MVGMAALQGKRLRWVKERVQSGRLGSVPIPTSARAALAEASGSTSVHAGAGPWVLASTSGGTSPLRPVVSQCRLPHDHVPRDQLYLGQSSTESRAVVKRNLYLCVYRIVPSLQVQTIQDVFHGFVKKAGVKFPDVVYVMNGWVWGCMGGRGQARQEGGPGLCAGEGRLCGLGERVELACCGSAGLGPRLRSATWPSLESVLQGALHAPVDSLAAVSMGGGMLHYAARSLSREPPTGRQVRGQGWVGSRAEGWIFGPSVPHPFPKSYHQEH